MSAEKIFTLSSVTASIKKTLASRYVSAYWIKAEMNKLNHYSHSGHCYPELVEKDSGRVVAQMKSTLWHADYQRINKKFLEILQEPIRDGIKILFQAKVTFDPVHGISLHILDIDPSYTLGDLEQEKKETIERLKKEQVFELNKRHAMPLLPQRLAIISVETSKGYADFIEVLQKNPDGYRFFHMLFPALLQGEKAIDSIISQLNLIRKIIRHFDAVCIIRGGGGDVGLSCYNNYHLAREVATFPIPVLTGIGHATNETVTEMVSYRNGITPTRVAEDLIRQFHAFARPVESARQLIFSQSKLLLADTQARLQTECRLFRRSTESMIDKNRQRISTERSRLLAVTQYTVLQQKQHIQNQSGAAIKGAKSAIKTEGQTVKHLQDILKKDIVNTFAVQQEKISRLESEVNLLSPHRVLQRGYSITLYRGKSIKNADELHQGEIIQTILADGQILSRIENTEQKNE